MPRKSKSIIVQKFGGTSVHPTEQLFIAARCVIKALHKGWQPVVVVSAPGRKGDPYATDTLKRLAEDLDPQVPVEPRELDLLMTCGEIISIVLMAQAIRVLSGYDTIALTGGQAGIYTDYEFGNARILEVDTSYIRRCIRENKIPVVAGFQGVTKRPASGKRGFVHGAITTLGRGGSDTTAAALAAALEAQFVEIYTDVDGIMSADPRIVGNCAKRWERLTYEEVAELAHLGAKVVHPRAIEIAMESRTPLWVKKPESATRGTCVDELLVEQGEDFHRITGVTQSAPVVHFQIAIEHSEDLPEFETEIYRALGDSNISLHFNARTQDGFEFVIARENLANALAALEGLPIPVGVRDTGRPRRIYVLTTDPRQKSYKVRMRMLQQALNENATSVEVKETQMRVGANRVLVSLVAPNVREHPQVLAGALRALNDNHIEVLQMADAQHSLSFLVHEEDAQMAVTTLHRQFFG